MKQSELTPEQIERQKERDFQRELETEQNCLMYINGEECYTEEFPKEGVDIQDYYFDQSPYNSKFYDRRITAFLLPYGIMKIDSWLGRQIRLHDGRFSKEDLERMIKRNPHLHNVIKTNLLSNLMSVS